MTSTCFQPFAVSASMRASWRLSASVARMSVFVAIRIRNRPVPWDAGLEIAQEFPMSSLVEVNFHDADRSPVLGKHDRLAGMIVYRGEHPVPRNIFIGAADDVDMVFDGASLSKSRNPTQGKR